MNNPHPAAKKYRIRLIHLPYPDGYKVSGLQMSVRKLYSNGWNIRYNCATLLMISFMISVVPPPILRIRESR